METTIMEIVEFPQRQIVTTNCRLSNNGRDETFPKQRIVEHVRSNLGERCPLLSQRAPYLMVPNWRSRRESIRRDKREHWQLDNSLPLTTKYWTRGKAILQVIIIVQCNRVCSLKNRWIRRQCKVICGVTHPNTLHWCQNCLRTSTRLNE
jgi:hypothetical protein